MDQLANAINFYFYGLPVLAALVVGGAVIAIIMWKRARKE